MTQIRLLKGEWYATEYMYGFKWKYTDTRCTNCPKSQLSHHVWTPGYLMYTWSQKILIFPYSNWIKERVKLQKSQRKVLWPKVKRDSRMSQSLTKQCHSIVRANYVQASFSYLLVIKHMSHCEDPYKHSWSWLENMRTW